uniref:Fibronectin type III domain-containing protein n=1 Tax=Candidatus Kentrum sp. DK TaxID=2126562 RepID=A0A450TI98_9GAMM|nr:MAG: Fibronectin type III domain-containing protein [Candidatus Kentron sp. DK]
MSDFTAKRDAAVAAQSAAAQTIVDKQTSLQNLSDKIKSNIRYAEQAVDFDDVKLKTIGWGGRKDPTPLDAPDRAQDLVSGEQGEGSIELLWKKPISGGKVSAYEIRRRNEENRAEGWDVVKTSMNTEITLTGQPRGVQLEYVVVAMNKAGDGPPSNPVMAVL